MEAATTIALAAALSHHLPHLGVVADAHSDSELDGFIRSNLPCIARGRVAAWPCISAADGGASLLGPLADCTAPVASGDAYDARRTDVRVRDYVASLEPPEGDCVLPAPPYLKDFHLCREAALRGCEPPYSVPAPFADDLLNWFFDALVLDVPPAGAPQQQEEEEEHDSLAGLRSRAGDDYRFLYAGPPGSWTPLHHDVLFSASWSANVAGWKLWVLVAPELSNRLYRGGTPQGELLHASLFAPAEAAAVADVAVALGGAAWAAPPLASCSTLSPELLSPGARVACLQGPGDAVFVPGGWHHAVWNLGPSGSLTVSINHNWLPAAGLARAWAFLADELAAVRAAIAHVRDGGAPGRLDMEWERQCQRILRANSALNVDELVCALLGRCAALLPALGGGGGAGADLPVYAAPHALRGGAAAAALAAMRDVLAAALLDPYVAGRPPRPAECPVSPVLPPAALVAVRARIIAGRESPSAPLPWDWTAEAVRATIEGVTRALAGAEPVVTT